METDDRGVAVEITVEDDGEASASGGGGGSCTWTVAPYPFTGAEPPASVGPAPSPEHRLYLIYCDGVYVSTEWLGPAADAAASAVGLADRVLRHVLVDTAGIGVRPEARGVTGIPSLFWVEGYRGEPIAESITELGLTVDVEVSLATVTWDFGDGTAPVTGSLGQPWPEKSDVRHAYQHRGDTTITVTLELPARYRAAGGEWQDLPPIVRVAALPYVVEEVQAVRNR